MLEHPQQPNMSSWEDSNMIKPPSLSPWSSVNKPHTNGPNPARVVSDIVENAAVKASATGILSSNPRIQAAQSEWERKSQGKLHIQQKYSSDMNQDSLQDHLGHLH